MESSVERYMSFSDDEKAEAMAQILYDISAQPWLNEKEEYLVLARAVELALESENDLPRILLAFLLGVSEEELPTMINEFYCVQAREALAEAAQEE
jgi:hypothetical protein